MKIILSRKGFDSANGGFPSPILPDGMMVSLPIPEREADVKYSDLQLDRVDTYYSLMTGLKDGKIRENKQWQELNENTGCHLDPDIFDGVITRGRGWRGVFGQINGEQTHLRNQGVNEGDLFLFFGWFRKTVRVLDRYVYDKVDKDGRHILYGYLQIGEIIHPKLNAPGYDWIGRHPHLNKNSCDKVTNTLYLANERLTFAPELPGHGVFKFSKKLVLSKEGETRTKWALPDIFKETFISGQGKNPWKDGYFQSAPIGQEFVLEATDEIKKWAHNIIIPD